MTGREELLPENIGREALPFFQYAWQRYDTLPAQLAFVHGHFVCPIETSEWCDSWGRSDEAMHLELFVSRALHGQIKTRKLYVSDIEPDEPYDDYVDIDDEYEFDGQPLPMTRARALQHKYEHIPRLKLALPTHHHAIFLEFELYRPAHMESDIMSKEQLLSYLEFGISWYSRKEEKRLLRTAT